MSKKKSNDTVWTLDKAREDYDKTVIKPKEDKKKKKKSCKECEFGHCTWLTKECYCKVRKTDIPMFHRIIARTCKYFTNKNEVE